MSCKSRFGARITRAFSFCGAQISGSVGPKSKTQFAPAAAAMCEIPLSCPTKIESSRSAARCTSGRFFAKATRWFCQISSNLATWARSASPEMTNTDPRKLSRPSKSFPRSIQLSIGQFFFSLPLPGWIARIGRGKSRRKSRASCRSSADGKIFAARSTTFMPNASTGWASCRAACAELSIFAGPEIRFWTPHTCIFRSKISSGS